MDFSDLKKEDLKQRVRFNWKLLKRRRIWQAIVALHLNEDKRPLDRISGVELVEYIVGDLHCHAYAVGNGVKDSDLVPGILEHDGNPNAGDLIMYGSSINRPLHIGIWQEDGTVISKWGDIGPVMKHEWDLVIPDYGNRAFFTSYKNDHSRRVL